MAARPSPGAEHHPLAWEHPRAGTQEYHNGPHRDGQAAGPKKKVLILLVSFTFLLSLIPVATYAQDPCIQCSGDTCPGTGCSCDPWQQTGCGPKEDSFSCDSDDEKIWVYSWEMGYQRQCYCDDGSYTGVEANQLDSCGYWESSLESGPSSVNVGDSATFTFNFWWENIEGDTNTVTGESYNSGTERAIVIDSPSGSTTCFGPYQDYAITDTSGDTESCTVTFDEQGTWEIEAHHGPNAYGARAQTIHQVNVCNSAGASCTQNKDCCSGMCEYKEDTDSYECIDSCPAEFQWDGNNPGDCVYQGAACYTSDGSQGTCTSLPEWGACTPSETACCYDTTYDGVDYGEEQGITEY